MQSGEVRAIDREAVYGVGKRPREIHRGENNYHRHVQKALHFDD